MTITVPTLYSLGGKVAIVTGSTRGIGRTIATGLAQAGASVVVSSEDAAAVSDAQAALAAQGLTVLGVPCDVRERGQLVDLVEQTISHFGRLDILVCNAGIAGRAGPDSDGDLDDFDVVMAINLRSAAALTAIALPKMTSGGSVVLISSIAGLRGNGGLGSYALAKAGIAQLARNLAVKWGPRGIRVNALSPGLIDTEFANRLIKDEVFMAQRMRMTPLRRVGQPEEVAAAALFLASAAGGFVSGHNLVVDGGTLITDGS